MFCTSCGAQIPDGSAVCPQCGTALSAGAKMGNVVNNAAGVAQNAFSQAEQSLGSAINDVSQSLGGQGLPPAGGPLKTDRSLVMYIILTIVTCGLYGYYFQYSMARDVNIACAGDGEETAGLIAYMVLSFVTCGIYSWIWLYKLGNRLNANAPRYGMNFQENGTTILMWCIFGTLLCAIGPYVAMHILIKNTNAICAAYNRSHGLM